jgi:hypothetical protein
MCNYQPLLSHTHNKLARKRIRGFLWLSQGSTHTPVDPLPECLSAKYILTQDTPSICFTSVLFYKVYRIFWFDLLQSLAVRQSEDMADMNSLRETYVVCYRAVTFSIS